MTFYDLSKSERIKLVEKINKEILAELNTENFNKVISYFSDDDTYIRKSSYLSVGRIFFSNKNLQPEIIRLLDDLIKETDFKARQTTINAAGEIGKSNFEIVQHFFDKGLFDNHHSVRNGVIGSVKKMGEVNPKPVLTWAKKYLNMG